MKKADLIFMNARVYTVDDANPHAEAVAMCGKDIVFVGDNAGAEAYRGTETRVIDGAGRTLMPGFNDSHYHLMFGSMGLGDVDVRGIKSLDGLKTAVSAYAAANPDLPWLMGQGMAYEVPSDDEPLTRHHLDAIEQERPLTLMAFDYHNVWANTAALEQAGLLHGGPELPGNAAIIMGDDGRALGELREPAAFEPLLAHIPDPTPERRLELLKEGLAQTAAFGITSVQNMDGDIPQAQLYADLDASGELLLRVYIPYSVTPETPFDALKTEAGAMRDQFQSEMVRAVTA